MEFFTGLADYIGYILETPALKEIAEKVLQKKHEEYEEINKLEQKSLEELNGAKNILLKIIKDNGMPSDSFKPHWPAVPGYSENLLDELRRFEKGEISSHNFKSDALEGYLFEIAASISEQGHRELVKQFIVSDDKYREYHPIAFRNIRGNFIFSKTLPRRWEKTQVIEREKGFELWPSFDAFFIFQKAFSEITKNTTFAEAIKMFSEKSRSYLETKEVVDIIFAIEELRIMSEMSLGHHPQSTAIHYLTIDKFRWFATRAHTYLLKELTLKDEKTQDTKSDKLEFALNLDKSGDLWREPKSKYCYPMMESRERLNIIKLLVKHQAKTSDYFPTKELAISLGKDVDYVRSEKGKINGITKRKLKLKLLDGKQGSGYRISPGIKIKILTR